jgi:tRNA wybutosine-synthesizing protein 1
MEKVEFTDPVKERYGRIYGLAGRHSGVQICSWTKKALRDKGVCYKQKFYGVDCFRCCQMSPALAWCQENCVFCWRPMEWMKRIDMEKGEVESPQEIIDTCLTQRKRLLGGIGGAADVKREAFEKSFRDFPSHWAISLSGEPTIYPLLGDLVKELRAKKEVRSIFIVTNGQEPEKLRKLAKEDALPTQLYLSLVAPDEKLFKEINRPVYKDGWQRLDETLGLLPELDCRRVIRLTLIKGMNDHEEALGHFAELLERSKADFIEVKAYMFLGLSRQRLEIKNMPYHKDVREWSERLEKKLENYSIIDEDEPSRIVLLKRKDSGYPNLIG